MMRVTTGPAGRKDGSSLRGQLALFAVIGIVLLLLLLLLLFGKRLFGDDALDGELTLDRVGPVVDFVDLCTSKSLEKLLRRAGANGGYLETGSLRHSANAWDGETVPFPPQDVPFWSHLRPCAQSMLGCEASAQPPLCRADSVCPIASVGDSSVQEQVEAALPDEVEACLNGFAALSDRFSVERKGAATATLLFAGTARATLDMPVIVTEKESGRFIAIRDFEGEAEIDMGRIYLFANEVANAQRETSFLERLTLHLIGVYSGIQSPLPPMRAVTLLGEKRYWSRTQVERLLQEELLPWTGFIQVPNAQAGFIPLLPPEEQLAAMDAQERLLWAGIFHYLSVKVGETPYPDYKVRFFYPDARPYLSINGGQELLKPRSADVGGALQKLLGVFINDYRFRYDLIYPVIVTVRDDAALDGRGYDWSFALEANIYRNEPVNRSSTAPSFVIANQHVDFAAPQQRVRNTIRIATKDRQTGEPLPFTRISYRCGNEYLIGETGEDGVLTTRLPYCRYGGAILFSRAGYLGSGEPYDNYEEGIVKEFSFALWPLQNLTFTVRKRTPEDVQELTETRPTLETIRSKSHELNASDLVILNIERIAESEYDEPVPLVGFFTFSVEEQDLSQELEQRRRELELLRDEGILTQGDVDDYLAALAEHAAVILPAQPEASIVLAPGEYRVEAYLLDNRPFTIPEETRDFCVDPFCLSKREMTLPENNFTMWLKGIASMNETQPLRLTPNIIYANHGMTLYLLEQEIPSTWTEMESYRMPDEYAEGKRLLQLPTFT